MRLTGLSRMTVRQAIDSLTREGLLRRVHGRGTYIVPDRVDQDLFGVYSFSQRMQSEGLTVHTELHQADIDRPAPTRRITSGWPRAQRCFTWSGSERSMVNRWW